MFNPYINRGVKMKSYGFAIANSCTRAFTDKDTIYIYHQCQIHTHAYTYSSPVNLCIQAHTQSVESGQSVKSVAADSEVESQSPCGQMKIYEMYTQSSL